MKCSLPRFVLEFLNHLWIIEGLKNPPCWVNDVFNNTLILFHNMSSCPAFDRAMHSKCIFFLCWRTPTFLALHGFAPLLLMCHDLLLHAKSFYCRATSERPVIVLMETFSSSVFLGI